MRPARAVHDALDALAPPVGDFATALGLFGNRTGELAAAIAGTGDRKSHAFKAAMRNVQRYRDGTRRPTAATLNKIRAAAMPKARAATIAAAKADGLNVKVLDALVAVSSDERWRYVEDVYCSPESLNATGFFDAAGKEQWGNAADALAASWGSEYGIGYGVQWLDVDALELELGE